MSREEVLLLAAQVVTGCRPSGGPYTVTVGEGARWKPDRDFCLYICLTDKSEGGECYTAEVDIQEWEGYLRRQLSPAPSDSR